MASGDNKIVLTVKIDDEAYRETLGRLHTLADLARQARPPSVVREIATTATVIVFLLWLGAVIGHLTGW